MEDADGKIIVSPEELMRVLYHWLSLQLAPPDVKRRAREWHIRQWTRELRRRFRCELVALETWITLDISLIVFGDMGKLRPIWDGVLSAVYMRLARVKDVSWEEWASSLVGKWKQYDTAMKTKDAAGPPLALAERFDANLFGECRCDIEALMLIMFDIVTTEKGLREALDKYEVQWERPQQDS